MRGFFATLTDCQKKAALEYRGEENHGSESFMRGPNKALKTHCKNGHEFTPENTAWKIDSKTKLRTRVCKKCKSVSNKRRYNSFRVSRDDLRRLVDVVWNEATESTAVPSTKWADRLIDKALAVSNGDREGAT